MLPYERAHADALQTASKKARKALRPMPGARAVGVASAFIATAFAQEDAGGSQGAVAQVADQLRRSPASSGQSCSSRTMNGPFSAHVT